MKLTARQLRNVISKEAGQLVEARKTVTTGSRNPATGFGIAKKDRFVAQVANTIAANIDDAVREAIEGIDLNGLVEKLIDEFNDEGSARPHLASRVGAIKHQDLEKAVVSEYKRNYNLDEEVKDLVWTMVEEVINWAQDQDGDDVEANKKRTEFLSGKSGMPRKGRGAPPRD